MLGTLQELAVRVGGRVLGDGSGSVSRISAVDDADGEALAFATDEKYLALALAGKAAAVLVDASVPLPERAPKPLIVVENARAALATLLAALKSPRPRGPFRHTSAVVEDGAHIGEDVYLGAGCYIAAGVRLGRGTVIGPGAYVGADATIGEECWLHPRAVVHERCSIGNRVVLHSGSVVGSEGFGWAFLDGRLERIPQVGNVVLDDDVEIGANSCIDRAQTGSTHIGTGTKIDNLVQIGHNCRIGRHCAIAAQTGFAGSTNVGDGVRIAGQVGTRGHMHIGSGSTVAGQSGVWGDVAEGSMISGNPARDHRETLRTEVMLRKLPKLIARVDALERERTREPQ
ncbi:MAG TPA: UDP-3-O-(3-hydroxymyristoyl)glucosamine N-acyltransferase [Candidatus Baltobacteraceae bacterium]|jgi:UDP-3-O-[3-hydroxymyristoyl] glucosamine N-acyltransferase|nr:UDP-3-O-(3-hydroxymyristoyl)glucosamine N-acyltransferase [Candidatus Baltobacteraceae bacterium]